MRIILLTTIVGAILLILLSCALTIAEPQPSPATQSSSIPKVTLSRKESNCNLTMDIAEDSYELGEHIPVKLTYSNTSLENNLLLHRNQIMWLVFFDITRDGKPVVPTAYGISQLNSKVETTGVMLRPPLVIESKTEMVIEFDLDQYFDLTLPGEYTISPKPPEGVDPSKCDLSKPVIMRIKYSGSREQIQFKKAQ